VVIKTISTASATAWFSVSTLQPGISLANRSADAGLMSATAATV
jgi:hypothetical protein